MISLVICAVLKELFCINFKFKVGQLYQDLSSMFASPLRNVILLENPKVSIYYWRFICSSWKKILLDFKGNLKEIYEEIHPYYRCPHIEIVAIEGIKKQYQYQLDNLYNFNLGDLVCIGKGLDWSPNFSTV